MTAKSISKFFAAVAVVVAVAIPRNADACSRVAYYGEDSIVVVGRSLDWKTPIPTNLWVYPRGVVKQSHNLPGALTWSARYGSVYVVSYDGGITEGMNEKGLVVNGLFCKGAVYSDGSSTTGRAPMSLAMFIAWIIDNNATVPEAVAALENTPFEISGSTFDGGTVSALHWGLTDAAGRCAVLEFDGGKMRIYQGDAARVLTNDPPFADMQAIVAYWRNVGGVNMLPGTVRSSDRYVRAAFFLDHLKRVADAPLAVDITRSLVENVSVPYSYNLSDSPNISSTQWRTFANLRDLHYYFDSVTAFGMYYIDLKKVDIAAGAPVMKLDTDAAARDNVAGCANSRLVPTAPFTPMY